ncbi:histone-lysine N-methyltransferase SETMAR [Trichonephila inaurata madagascariensis]|uniref:Histone-lysine N-methyltransferase SETMAR n=1 Tax=Trichonephila inaurata madagascariensis TaxID=2747483 RepID=A0A8X6X6G7_9ARAC|nr:histone-lysine N-methyltransferase SETMAR [Trichonephila inaurata madagascariensis]
MVEKPSDERRNISCYKRRSTAHIHQSELGNLSLCDKNRTGRPQALDDEALQAAIEEDSSQTCGELAIQINTSSETVRLHLHRLGKTYRLSKWVLHTLLEFHKQQRLAACLSLLSRHSNGSIFSRVLTSDEKWVLYDTPKLSKPGYCPAQRKTTYAPTQDYALCLVDLPSSGSL